MFDVDELHNAISNKDFKKIAKIIKDNTDVIKLDGKKIIANEKKAKEQNVYWDMMQLIRKVLSNACYGSLGNPGSRWFRQDLAQSTTLTGRCVVKHQGSEINAILTGKYDHLGDATIYGDTDSVFSSAIIRTIFGNKTIEELFLSGNIFWNEGDKEYSKNNNIKILEYESKDKTIDWSTYNYVYRHKTSKQKFKINTANGKSVIVTGDHAIMVLDEKENLIEKKASEIKKGDRIISLI